MELWDNQFNLEVSNLDYIFVLGSVLGMLFSISFGKNANGCFILVQGCLCGFKCDC